MTLRDEIIRILIASSALLLGLRSLAAIGIPR